MSFDYRSHEAGYKPTSPQKTTFHGVVRDTSGARKKTVWVCTHRHRDQWAAKNCASKELGFATKEALLSEWEQAPVEITPPDHFFVSRVTSKLCADCYHSAFDEQHMPILRTTISVRAGHLEDFARWVGPKMGFTSAKGGIYFAGERVCKGWSDLIFMLGFVKDLANLEPGERYPNWRQPRRGDSTDYQGNIIATQIGAYVVR